MAKPLTKPFLSSGGDEDVAFEFVPEENATHAVSEQESFASSREEKGYKVLSVDDDVQFQQSLRFALRDFRYQNRRIELIEVQSAHEAATLLSREKEIALMLLDVVMETDDAGLRLVKSIREVLGNAEIRIILITGQPGMAPLRETLFRLDINDYCLKTELSLDRLQGIVANALRTWDQLVGLSRARRGLQLIVEAANALAYSRDLEDFSARVIQEVTRLLGLPPEGVVCVQEHAVSETTAKIVGGSGVFAELISHPLSELKNESIQTLLYRCLREKQTTRNEHGQALYFSGTQGAPSASAYVGTTRVLDPVEVELLDVLASNISSGLANVALVSRLDAIAYQDQLLGIPNGNALVRIIDSVIDAAGTEAHSLLVLDVDQFSESCQALGLQQGELLLKKVSQRLARIFCPPTVIARLHNDVFAVFGLKSVFSKELIACLESHAPDEPDRVPFISLCSSRIDLDHFSGSGAEVLSMALVLLKQAKRRGLNQTAIYVPGMEAACRHRFAMALALHQALHADQISIELQPQIDLATGKTFAAEVLARWRREDGTNISPLEFIAVGEANGDIVLLGEIMLRKACRAVRRIAEAGWPDFRVAVNVSALQLAKEGLVEDFLAILREEGIESKRIELEITESAIMEGDEATQRLMDRFRSAGFSLAIDDFGTGHSSLARLRSLPAAWLKVDRSFTREIGQHAIQLSITDMIIKLGMLLGMKVLAEGVETPEQVAWLKQQGCHAAQGYWYARPMPLDDLLVFLANRA